MTRFSSPPKIKNVRIIDNPFDDIVPRITAEEKRAQQRARAEAMKEREDAERRKGAKKYVCLCSSPIFAPNSVRSYHVGYRDKKLLSFGADEDMDIDDSAPVFQKKNIVRPDRTSPHDW